MITKRLLKTIFINEDLVVLMPKNIILKEKIYEYEYVEQSIAVTLKRNIDYIPFS